MGKKVLGIWAIIAVSLCIQTVSFAVVLHPDSEPNLAEWTDRPNPDVIGRWGTNASCVAVSTNAVITTRHQYDNGIGTIVEFAGKEYTVEEIICEPDDNADLRLCRVKRVGPGATYLKYAPLYTTANEFNKEIVIGGYGKARNEYISDEIGEGYSWTGDNQTQRWGTNKILSLSEGYCQTVGTETGYVSQTIKSAFDPEGTTPYEAAMASYDSGGGWFIKDRISGQWQLAAVNGYVEVKYTSYYDPADYQWGIRISAYDDWISRSIFERVDGDYSGDYEVDLIDFAIFASNWQKQQCLENNNCDGTDCEPDGDVDFEDLIFFLNSWLY